MKVVVGIATMAGRNKNLPRVIQSLKDQCDDIHIYDNSRNEVDFADNGKFYFLQYYKEPVYYFACDDDIIYPPTYIVDMIEAIERLGTIVTHHGRVILGRDRQYYNGHKVVSYRHDNNVEQLVQVAGTGVVGFRTDYFNPINIYQSKFQRMSDIVFSLDAMEQEKKIHVLKHHANYFHVLDVPVHETIHGVESRGNQAFQILLTNKIYDLWKNK
jgi:hypothetical protein